MKYQLLPHFSNEDKYTNINPKTGRKKQISTYNARIDGLEKRQAWQSIFMRRHAVLAIEKFYEWVAPKGKSELVYFEPQSKTPLLTPCLWDHWVSADGTKEISSFAIITTEPPKEVLAAGHDRCPVFLEEKDLNTWLSPHKSSKEDIYDLLLKSTNNPREVFNCHSIMNG